MSSVFNVIFYRFEKDLTRILRGFETVLRWIRSSVRANSLSALRKT